MRALPRNVLLRRFSSAAPINPLTPILEKQGVAIIDGGFGTALGTDSEAHALWGAQHLFRKQGHEKVMAIHREFLEAGADIICSNSYNASFEIFSVTGAFTDGVTLPGGKIEKEKSQLRFASDVLRASVELAKKARYDYWADVTRSAGADKAYDYADPDRPKLVGEAAGRLRPLVAAAVGPAGDNLVPFTGATDASTNVHDLPDEAVAQYYRRKIAALCKAKPDLLALETLPGLHEARLALQAMDDIAPDLAKLGIWTPPAWVSFICRSETTTAAGDDFAVAAAEVASHPSVVATGIVRPPRYDAPPPPSFSSPHFVSFSLTLSLLSFHVGASLQNCTEPELVEPLLTSARARLPAGIVLLAYPNSGEAWDAREGRRCWHGEHLVLDGTHAKMMRTAGASLIGGCCRVSSGQIRAFRQALLGSSQ